MEPQADATATWEVLEAQLVKYPQLGTDVDSILKVHRRRRNSGFCQEICHGKWGGDIQFRKT